ncbi:hypothetical protein NM688_g8263 [Phlebia brevispora]|uniref:Uncharacterized protein n=1 Tax=Phlebia brevispora TaxID=194682 RepID=A0ACC1RV69_9APHY|nr:hypothetical protein NM688_g8263 [Phlebia brevispora]
MGRLTKSSSKAKPKLPWDLDSFIQATNYRSAFSIKDLDRFLEALTKKATSLTRDPERALTSPNIRRMVRLALYQHVIYCDDSSSMADNDRFTIAQSFIMSIAGLATRAHPDERSGVEVRFINSNATLSGRGEQLRAGLERIRPSGGNRLGTGLRTKVLQPFVFDVIKNGGQLKRPLLVSVIIDYAPDSEKRTAFRDVIGGCKKSLDRAGFPSTSALFMVTIIGDDVDARRYARELRGDSTVEDVLYCTTEGLRNKQDKLGSSDRNLEDWLLTSLMAPIQRVEGA